MHALQRAPGRHHDDDGNALASVLIMLAALTPLGAFAVMHARLDVLVQHHINRAATAFAVAESGLEHARAEIHQDPDFDRLINGPDRRPATSDDGEFPFLGSRLIPTHIDYQYALRVSRQSTSRIDIVSTATGPGGSMHALAFGVVRDRPLLPAAVTTVATRTTLDLGTEFRLVGIDRAGRDAAQPGLVVADTDVITSVRANLPSDAVSRMVGVGPAPSIAATAAPDIAHLAAEFGSRRTDTLAPNLDGTLGSGIAVSDGSLDVASASGEGVLLVNGTLRVAGALSFTGLLIVSGDIIFETSSAVHIQGGVLQGRGNGVLALLGSGSIDYDSSAIEKIDREFPDLLPHRALIVGWRDLS